MSFGRQKMLPERQHKRKIGHKLAVNVAKKATFTGLGTIKLITLFYSRCYFFHNDYFLFHKKYLFTFRIEGSDQDRWRTNIRLSPHFSQANQTKCPVRANNTQWWATRISSSCNN